MSYKLKIKVTKEILKKSMFCSLLPAENCAFALAVRDIFPNASVTSDAIYPFGLKANVYIKLPSEAMYFITIFDSLDEEPEKRLSLSELEIEVEITDEIIAQINISEVQKLLINHPTLELCIG